MRGPERGPRYSRAAEYAAVQTSSARMLPLMSCHMLKSPMDIVIVGAGICGLSLALNLHRRGVKCRVYERAPELTELGVGITLLPHAMREFAALGVADRLLTAGIENRSEERRVGKECRCRWSAEH